MRPTHLPAPAFGQLSRIGGHPDPGGRGVAAPGRAEEHRGATSPGGAQVRAASLGATARSQGDGPGGRGSCANGQKTAESVTLQG